MGAGRVRKGDGGLRVVQDTEWRQALSSGDCVVTIVVIVVVSAAAHSLSMRFKVLKSAISAICISTVCVSVLSVFRA